MSTTIGNGSFRLLGAGTATISSVLSQAVGIDGAITTPQKADQSFWSGVTSDTSVLTAGAAAVLGTAIQGTFRISVAGTIIPSFKLVSAAAAIVEPNTYFMARRISSSDTATTYGPWS